MQIGLKSIQTLQKACLINSNKRVLIKTRKLKITLSINNNL
jgi:hypothetical protein